MTSKRMKNTSTLLTIKEMQIERRFLGFVRLAQLNLMIGCQVVKV